MTRRDRILVKIMECLMGAFELVGALILVAAYAVLHPVKLARVAVPKHKVQKESK